MSDTDFNIPKSLAEALQKGKVVPFIGAGVSRSIEKKEKDSAKSFNPLFPSWWEFLNKAVIKLIEENKQTKADVVRSLLISLPDPSNYPVFP